MKKINTQQPLIILRVIFGMVDHFEYLIEPTGPPSLFTWNVLAVCAVIALLLVVAVMYWRLDRDLGLLWLLCKVKLLQGTPAV